MLDENTAVFAAGNTVQLLNLQTNEQKYIRSSSGGGVGAITVSTYSQTLKRYFIKHKLATGYSYILQCTGTINRNSDTYGIALI